MIVHRKNPNWARIGAHDITSVSFSENFSTHHQRRREGMSRKLAMQEYSAQLPYPNRARSTPRVCRPKVWRARACPATHSVRVVRLHLDASRQCLPVIPDPQPEMPLVIPNFHFDPLRLRVLEGIAQRLARNPVDFVPQDRMKVPWRSFHLHTKLGSIWVRFTGREFLTQSAYRGGKIVGHDR